MFREPLERIHPFLPDGLPPLRMIDLKADIMSRPCCMIVEDQALIGMSLEAFLEEAGFSVAGPFVSNGQALQWLESHTPDIAILDIMIKDGTSLGIASALRNRGIPFAIYSGLPPKADGPPEVQGAPWLEKPVSRETLLSVLEKLAGIDGWGQTDRGSSEQSLAAL